MSPRRNHPRRPTDSSAARRAAASEGESGHGSEHTETWRDEDWAVRPVVGSAAGKHYRCPGCDQEIPPGVGHVVAWPHSGGVDVRRHWHRACWNARDRRAPKVQRSRKVW